MTSFNNWQVYCITEDDWIFTESTTKPTECPNNGSHPIRSVRPRPLPSLQNLESDNDIIVDETFDIGFFGKYVDNGVTKYTGIFCDASDNVFKVYSKLEVPPIATVDITGDGFTISDMQVGKLINTGITSSGDIYLSGDLNVTGNVSGIIDHTSLTNIGSNTHVQIDSHISSTNNPHSVDIDDVTPTTTKGDILVENGSNVIRLPVGSNDTVLTADSGEASGLKWGTVAVGSSDIDIAIVRDEKSQGTNGGTFSNGAWRIRDLNTLEQTGSFCSLSNDEFTLTAGKYYLESLAPAYSVSGHQSRLYNVTDSSTAATGSNTHEASSSGSNSIVKTTLDISSSKTYRIEHRCESTDSGDGFGQAMGWGTEIYTIVTITKIG